MKKTKIILFIAILATVFTVFALPISAEENYTIKLRTTDDSFTTSYNMQGGPDIWGDKIDYGAHNYGFSYGNYVMYTLDGVLYDLSFYGNKVTPDQLVQYGNTFTLKPHEHYYTEKIYTTVCEGGIIHYTCFDCGHYYSETVIGSGEHTYTSSRITLKPTCEVEGERTYYCDCGAEKTETVAALGHDIYWYTLGNCTREGCDYKEDIVENIKNGISDFEEDTISDFTNGIDNTFKKISLVVGGILMIVAIIAVVPPLLRLIEAIINRKNNRW